MALNMLTLIACSFLVSLLILTWEVQSIDARPLKSRSKNELQNLPIHTKTHKNKSEDNAGHKRYLHGKSTTEASSVVVSPPPPQSDQVDGAAQLPPPPAHAVEMTSGPQLLATAPALDILYRTRYLHGKSTTEASSVVVSPPPPQSDQVDGAAQLPPPPAHAVDDFRPTAPGHSPGVGHSLQN